MQSQLHWIQSLLFCLFSLSLHPPPLLSQKQKKNNLETLLVVAQLKPEPNPTGLQQEQRQVSRKYLLVTPGAHTCALSRLAAPYPAVHCRLRLLYPAGAVCLTKYFRFPAPWPLLVSQHAILASV